MFAGHWSLFKHWILSYRSDRCRNILYILLRKKKVIFAIFCIQSFKKNTTRFTGLVCFIPTKIRDPAEDGNIKTSIKEEVAT